MEKRRWFILVGIVVAVLSLAVLAAACGDDDGGDGNGGPTETVEPGETDEPTATEPADGESTIDLSLEQFAAIASDDTADAGSLTFTVTNYRTIPYDLTV